MEKTAHTKMDLELMMESSDLSKAENNFVCVSRVCKDVIKLPLIDVLDHYISPNELYKKIQSCSMLFSGKNKLSVDQLKCCFFQPPLLPDYKTFDFPLLYKLISHLCPSLRPTQGWGIEPKRTDTLIGDDIERLRMLSIRSTLMSDGKFEEIFNSVQHSVRRFRNFMKNCSNYNYEEDLLKIEPKKLGYKYPKKEEQLENVQLTLMPPAFSNKKDEPVILISGAEKAICGSTIQFKSHVKPANTPEWSGNWQKNRTGATEQIDITSRKYSRGSHNRQFVINSVEKEEEGKCHAFISRGSNRKIHKILSKDIPIVIIVTDYEIVFGSKTKIKAFILSFPSICGMEWQKSIDKQNFSSIDVKDPKHEGSSRGPNLPLLVITNTTFEDVLYYRLRVWNKDGEIFSNTLHLNVKRGHPNVLTRCIINNKNRSVTLIGNVSATGENSKVQTVYWSKDGEIIDNKVGERKYSKVTVEKPSLTIHNVNHQDAGSYRFTAISSAGSNEGEIVFEKPEIYIERHENPDGRRWFTAKIKSIPEAYHVQWTVKRNGHEDFALIDVNDPAYKGTSNSLNCPVLVVQEKELLENHFFHIKVDDFIGSSKKEIFDTPIQYLFYQPGQDFNHFHYVYNLIRNCESRVVNIHLSKEQKKNLMSKDVVIKIGVVGIFHEDNLHLISGGTWRETLSEDQQVWDVSPVLCFQNDLPLNSVLKIIRNVDARHRIIIKSDTICKEAEKTEDSIVIVGKNKQKIKENITICLEEPFHQILKEWLKNFSNQGLTELSSEIIAEIKEIRKHLDFEKSKLTTGISCLQGGGIKSIVPYNVQDFLLRVPYVNSFGIWGTSFFKVFVQKETDKYKLEKDLLNINKIFFDNFNLEIVKGKFVQKKTLKQGDHLLSCKRNDSALYNSGTIGGFVRKNDNKRKIYALTCNHIFPEENQLAYAKDSDGFREMGACVFTTREKACDFAAIELKESFSDTCDVTVRRDDEKKVNAKVYKKNLRNVGLVHKIGAATNVTSGRIISWEYYDKEMDSDCRESIFLVKGLNGPFSKEGDSGSLVFSRPNSVIQNYVNVLGMVYAQNITIDYDDDDNEDQHGTSAACNIADNISVCYRIHTALELFKKSQGEGFDVKFQDDLSVTLSSSLQSLRSDDSI